MNTSQPPTSGTQGRRRRQRRKRGQRNMPTAQTSARPGRGGISLSNCTNTVHKIDLTNRMAGDTGSWRATGNEAWTALLTDPDSIRCIEIRSELHSGTMERGTVGLRSDSHLYATWLFLHSTDARSNRFEDIVFWCPSGVKATGWESYSSLVGGTGGHSWKLDVRIWRLSSTAQREGWVSNPLTSMDLDTRGRW